MSFRWHDGDSNENFKNAIGWIDKITTLHTQQAFCKFLAVTARLWHENAWFHILMRTWTSEIWNCLSLSELKYGTSNNIRELTPKEFPCIWKNKRVRIIVIEIKRMKIQFLSIIMAAIAVNRSQTPSSCFQKHKQTCSYISRALAYSSIWAEYIATFKRHLFAELQLKRTITSRPDDNKNYNRFG